MSGVSEFRSRLLERREELARLGALVRAEFLLDEILAELDAAVSGDAGQLLRLSAAAEVSGYTADHLRTLIKSGKLTNYGRPHAPRVRRGELPRKPGHRSSGGLTQADAVANLKSQIVGNAIPATRRRHHG